MAKKNAVPKTQDVEQKPKGFKRVRVKLSYVMRVADDFPTHLMGRGINKLIANGVLAFTRNDDEVIQTEGGARLQMTALGRKASL